MNIKEIITNPIRDEYLDQYDSIFDNVPPIARIRELELKKIVSEDEIQYALTNKSDQVVGYFKLAKYNSKLWQARKVQIAQAYKGQEYGTFFYDYAVMDDKLSILSDINQSEGGPGGSKGLWLKLYNHGRYNVEGYNLDTDTIIPNATPDMVYNQKENVCWIATAKTTETINEMLSRHNARYEGQRYIVWYGPTIVNGD